MVQVNFKQNIVIATIAIITIGLAIAPTVFSNVAQAQQVATQGQYQGTLICSSKSSFNTFISFNNINPPPIWNINAGPGNEMGSTITGVTFHGPNNFVIKGIKDVVDNLCGTIGSTITIKGSCGTGVTIQYTASKGERGTFPGATVICN